jgi:hypothetical protein
VLMRCPWDAAISEPDNGAPHVIPTHFAVDGDTLLVHLARPNMVWAAIQARPIVVMSVVDDCAYIPTTWRAKAGGPDEDGVPTSYYSAVQLTCHAEIIDDPQRKTDLLRCECRKPSSTSCDQAIFVDEATGAGLSSYAVLLKIDRFGQRFQRRGCVQGAMRAMLIVVGLVCAGSAADGTGSR